MRTVPVAARSRFHVWLALALSALVFVAFARTYYLAPLFGTSSATRLVHLHAATFTAWLAVFALQAWLVATRRTGLHVRLGWAGAALAAVTIASSAATVFAAAAAGRGRGGLSALQQMAIPLTGLALFTGFVAAAILFRRRRALHGRLMTLALLGALGPAIARLWPGIAIQLAVLAVVLGLLFRRDYVTTGHVHPVHLLGGAALAASWPLRFAIARSEAWASFAAWLVG